MQNASNFESSAQNSIVVSHITKTKLLTISCNILLDLPSPTSPFFPDFVIAVLALDL